MIPTQPSSDLLRRSARQNPLVSGHHPAGVDSRAPVVAVVVAIEGRAMSDDQIRLAAEVVHAGHCCPCDLDGCDEPDPADWRAARALQSAGLLAPAPLRDDANAGVGWYEVICPSRATTHIAYVHEDGSIYFPEGTQVLGRSEFDFAAARGLVHRLVRTARQEMTSE